MTLLITIFAAVICTALWYQNAPADDMKLGTLCLIYWGASLMWIVDSIVEYIAFPIEFFYPLPKDMLNDAFLGASCVALGMIIWLITVFVKDPKGVIYRKLTKPVA